VRVAVPAPAHIERARATARPSQVFLAARRPQRRRTAQLRRLGVRVRRIQHGAGATSRGGQRRRRSASRGECAHGRSSHGASSLAKSVHKWHADRCIDRALHILLRPLSFSLLYPLRIELFNGLNISL
jgi:hypothetical protein